MILTHCSIITIPIWLNPLSSTSIHQWISTHTYIYILLYIYMYNVRILSPSLLAKLQYHMGFIVFTSFLPVRDPGEELRIVFTVVSLIIRPQWRWFGSSLPSQSSIYVDDLWSKKTTYFFPHHSEAHTRSQRKSNINHECGNQDARWLNQVKKGTREENRDRY